MKADIWMPFYMGDYLKDTMKLSPEKHGIYLLLIINYWQEGPLSDDIGELAVVARVESDSKSLKYILDTYFTLSDGRYRQKRIDAEIQNATDNKERLSTRGRKGAEARWNATSNAQALPKQCPSPSPSPSESSIPKRETRKRFKKPTIEELKEYGESIGFAIDAQHFLDYHDMTGWKLKSGNKMADWKATVRTWKRNNFNNFTQSTHTELTFDDKVFKGNLCQKHSREIIDGKCPMCEEER